MEMQELQSKVVWDEDAGYENLLGAVRRYEDPAEVSEPDSPVLENEANEESVAEFLGSCLTTRQLEVTRKAGRGALDGDASDIRLWSKIRNSILRHPAVVGKLALFSDKTPLNYADEPEWKERASCAGNNRFVSSSVKTQETKLTLMGICEGCPVYDECLSYIGDNKPEVGFWAGVSRGPGKGKSKHRAYDKDGRPKTLEEEREAMRASDGTNGKPE